MMLSCDVSLELWYYTVVILMVGWLKNPEIAVDAISIWLVSCVFIFFLWSGLAVCLLVCIFILLVFWLIL